MGKKKILKQTEEELLKETKDVEDVIEKGTASSPKAGKKIFKRGKAYVDATYNNTRITITDENGNTLAWSSAGSLGFKGAKKSTPYAATKVAKAVMDKIQKTGLQEIEVFVRGIGSGRESATRSLANMGLHVYSIKDITPVPHNGCKAKKPRRV